MVPIGAGQHNERTPINQAWSRGTEAHNRGQQVAQLLFTFTRFSLLENSALTVNTSSLSTSFACVTDTETWARARKPATSSYYSQAR